jgi:hypothetical protein
VRRWCVWCTVAYYWSVGKGIATLSFDQEYQRKRREQQAQPVDLKEGLARGGKGLVMVSHFLSALRYYLIMTSSM